MRVFAKSNIFWRACQNAAVAAYSGAWIAWEGLDRIQFGAHSGGGSARRAISGCNPMAIIGHGIDLVRIDRIATMIDKHGSHFLDRCFTATEQAYCQDHSHPAQHYAGRFALKEAVLKALGTGWRGQIAWTDIDAPRAASGRPVVILSGECGRIAESLGIRRWHISISHAGDYAMASAVAED